MELRAQIQAQLKLAETLKKLAEHAGESLEPPTMGGCIYTIGICLFVLSILKSFVLKFCPANNRDKDFESNIQLWDQPSTIRLEIQ